MRLNETSPHPPTSPCTRPYLTTHEPISHHTPAHLSPHERPYLTTHPPTSSHTRPHLPTPAHLSSHPPNSPHTRPPLHTPVHLSSHPPTSPHNRPHLPTRAYLSPHAPTSPHNTSLHTRPPLPTLSPHSPISPQNMIYSPLSWLYKAMCCSQYPPFVYHGSAAVEGRVGGRHTPERPGWYLPGEVDQPRPVALRDILPANDTLHARRPLKTLQTVG